MLKILALSCMTSSDKDAPQIMLKEGAAACFVGLEVSPEDDEYIQSFYNKRILENRLKKETVESKIIQTRKCVSDPYYLKDCKLAMTANGRLKDIPGCQYFANKPIVKIKKSSNGVSSKDYRIALPDGWTLSKEKIQKDSRTFIFQNENRIIQLSVSDVFSPEKYRQVQTKLKSGLSQVWQNSEFKMIRSGTGNYGAHQSADEAIGFDQRKGIATAQYYLYGPDRISIVTVTAKGSASYIKEYSRKLLERFEWN